MLSSIRKFHGFNFVLGPELSLRRNSSTNTALTMQYQMDQLRLSPGHRYGLRMTVINRAGLSSVQDSPGVTIDITAPHVSGRILSSMFAP